MRRLRALMQQFFLLVVVSVRRGVDQMCMRVVKIPGAKSFLFPIGRLRKRGQGTAAALRSLKAQSARGSREGKSRR
jgi:hypothetical protein